MTHHYPRHTAGRCGAMLCLAAAVSFALPVQAQFYWPYNVVKDFSIKSGPPGFSVTTSYRFQYGGILEDGRAAALYSSIQPFKRGIAAVDANGHPSFAASGSANCLLSASSQGFWTIVSDSEMFGPFYHGGRSFGPDVVISGLYLTALGSSQRTPVLLNEHDITVPKDHRLYTLRFQAASARGAYAAALTRVRYELLSNDDPDFDTFGDHDYTVVRYFDAYAPSYDYDAFGYNDPGSLQYNYSWTARGGWAQAYSPYQKTHLRINSIGQFSISEGGNIGFIGSASSDKTGVSHSGIFLWQGTEPETCPGPENTGGIFTIASISTFYNEVAFLYLEENAIYVTSPSVKAAKRILGNGDISNGYTIGWIDNRIVYDNGRLLFGAQWRPADNSNVPSRFGLFVYRNGQVYPVISQGQVLNGAVVSKITAWDMNYNGQVVFGYNAISFNAKTSARYIGTAFFFQL